MKTFGKRFAKRILSIILAVIMTTLLVPVINVAAEENVTFTVRQVNDCDGSGTVTIIQGETTIAENVPISSTENIELSVPQKSDMTVIVYPDERSRLEKITRGSSTAFNSETDLNGSIFYGDSYTYNFTLGTANSTVNITWQSIYCTIEYSDTLTTLDSIKYHNGAGNTIVYVEGAPIESGAEISTTHDVTFDYTADQWSFIYRITANGKSIYDYGNLANEDPDTPKLSTYTYEKDAHAFTEVTSTLHVYVTWALKTYVDSSDNTEKDVKHNMSSDSADSFSAYSGFSQSFELCGVQTKTNGQALRYVAAIDTNLIRNADEYGFLLARTNKGSDEGMSMMRNLVYENSNAIKIDCTGTSNTISDNFGLYEEDTAYKYVTLAIENISDTDTGYTIMIRSYIKLSDGQIFYGDYFKNNDTNTYPGISASYNLIKQVEALMNATE